MEKSSGDVEIIKAIGDHIERHIGKIEVVFHEKVSSDIHVDVFLVSATPERPYQSLITSGMSEKPMSVPKGWEDGKWAELMICLPPSWPVNTQAFKDEKNYWPIRDLKSLARYPHENNTWLYAGHSVLFSGSHALAAGTAFVGALVRYPNLLSTEALTIAADGAKSIRLWGFTPLYREELDFKDRNGFARLEELLVEHRITELLDTNRKNVGRLQ